MAEEHALDGRTAEIKQVRDHGLVLEVDGHEVYVTAHTERTACSCCGDRTVLDVGYNTAEPYDPLDLREDG